MTTGIILSLLISILWISIQIGWMHIRPANNRFGAMAKGFAISLPLLAIALALPGIRAFHFSNYAEPYRLVVFHAFLSHLLIFFCYVECFYHIERAVTLRMLIEIAECPQGIPVSGLRQQYHVSEMVGTRLEVLHQKGFVVMKDNRWRLTPKGRLLARFMHFTLWLFQAKSQRERDAEIA